MTYVYKFKIVDESTTAKHISQTHLELVKLFNTFNIILLMDFAYKIN